MDARKLFVAILLAAIMLIQPVHGQPAGAGGTGLPIGLGFSQNTVSPVGAGVPVYTVGDQLWFRAYETGDVNVTLTQPVSGTGGSVSFTGTIPGNTSDSLFTFSNTDPSGAWQLTASNSSQSATVQFYLVSGGAPALLSGYTVGENGRLAMNYTLDSTTAYDVGACSAGNQSASTVYVPVPAALGGGTLLLTLNGTAVSVIPQGGSGSFTFWIGLSQDYAYQLNGSVTVVSKSMEVARTEALQVTGSLTSAFSTALLDELPMRTGQYTLSTNFETAQGVSASDNSVLLTGTGPWVWLRGCSAAADTLSSTVTVSASLQAGPSTWPRYVYVLYQQLGVGLFTIAPVNVQFAAVQVVAAPWGEPLTDSQVVVSGASQYAFSNGTIYIVGAQYPFGNQFPVQIRIATPQTPGQSLDLKLPYTVTQAQIPADKVVVRTTSDGSAVSGVVVSIGDSVGTLAVETSANGEAVFYLPPGNFTVQGSYGGVIESTELVMHEAAAAGQSLQVTLQFGSGTGGVVDNLLVALLGVGIVLSGIVWTMAYRRRNGGRHP